MVGISFSQAFFSAIIFFFIFFFMFLIKEEYTQRHTFVSTKRCMPTFRDGQLLLGQKKGGSQLQTKNIIGTVAYNISC